MTAVTRNYFLYTKEASSVFSDLFCHGPIEFGEVEVVRKHRKTVKRSVNWKKTKLNTALILSSFPFSSFTHLRPRDRYRNFS